jgi:hypothetical protein
MYPDYPQNTIRKALLALERGAHIDNIEPPVLDEPRTGRRFEVYASRSTHNAKLKEPFKQHSKMISDFCGVTHIACRRFNRQLHYWFQEPPGEKKKSLNPDAEFRIDDKFFYLECDRGTEPLRRDGGKSGTDIWQKYDHYTELFQRAQRKEKGYPPFRVLWVCLTKARIEAMLDLAVRHDPAGIGLNIFWFTKYDFVDFDQPELLFNEPYWFIPTDEEGHRLFNPKDAPTL